MNQPVCRIEESVVPVSTTQWHMSVVSHHLTLLLGLTPTPLLLFLMSSYKLMAAFEKTKEQKEVGLNFLE